MRLRQLEDVVAVADRGAVNAAASALGVPASTTAQSVRTLERELGLTLFVRAGNQLFTTAACRRLVPRFRAVLRAAASARASVGPSNPSGTTRLTIGLERPAPGGRLMRLVAAFLDGQPDVVVRVVPLDSPAESALAETSCDVIVAQRVESSVTPHAGIVLLERVELWAAAPPGTALPDPPDRAPLPLERIEGPVIVAPDGPLSGFFAHRGSRRSIVEPTEAHLALTLAGQGVSFVDAELAAVARAAGSVTRPVQLRPSLRHVVVFEPSELTPVARAFIDLAASTSAATVGSVSSERWTTPTARTIGGSTDTS